METLEITEDNSNKNISKKQLLEVFYKKSVPKYFAKFIGKHLCQNLFFNKNASLRPATLSKRDFGKGAFL